MMRSRSTLLACVLIVACGDDSSEGDADKNEIQDAAVRHDGGIDASSTPPSSDSGAHDAGRPVEKATDASAGDAGAVVHLSEVYDSVFNNAGLCSVCHPLFSGNVDFSTLEKTYQTLVMSPLVQCGGKPMVTPGDPSKSYLVDIVTLDKPCASKPDIGRMPNFLPPLSTEQVDLIKQWISDGAQQ